MTGGSSIQAGSRSIHSPIDCDGPRPRVYAVSLGRASSTYWSVRFRCTWSRRRRIHGAWNRLVMIGLHMERDCFDRAAAARAGLHINLEGALDPLRPAHRCLLFSRRAVRFSRRLDLPGTPTPAGRRDPGPIGAVGCEHPVEAG